MQLGISRKRITFPYILRYCDISNDDSADSKTENLQGSKLVKIVPEIRTGSKSTTLETIRNENLQPENMRSNF